jgi:hypothetical protein
MFDPAAAGPGYTTITYSVTDGNGCAATATASITVQALPQVSAGQFGPFCLNDPAILLATGSPSGGTYTGNGVSNGVFDPTTAGVGVQVITYTYTDPVGCTNSATTNIDVIANPNAPVLSYSAPTLSSSVPGDSTQWFFNGNYLLTNGSNIVPAQNGNYSAIVWDNGCPSDTSAVLLVELLALENGNGRIQVIAWPNPVGEELNLEAAGIVFQASLSDALGREVRAPQEMDQQGKISMQGLAKGVYFARIWSDVGETWIKVVKE